MDPQSEPWIAAGGDPAKLDVYATIGAVAPFSDGNDRCLATIHPLTPLRGAIGDWVGGDAVRVSAEAWLRAQGCRSVRGPFEMSAWFPNAANLGPFEDPPYLGEPTELAGRWLAAGYAPAVHAISAVVDHDAVISSAMDRAAGLSASGWRLQTLPTADGRVTEASLREVAGLVHRMFGQAAPDDDGYAPVPVEALFRAYEPVWRAIDARLSHLALAPDGKVAGLCIALQDTANVDRHWFLIHTLALFPQYRQNGLGAWLLASAHQAGRRAGYRAGVHCLMRTPKPRHDLRRGRLLRSYATFEKAL